MNKKIINLKKQKKSRKGIGVVGGSQPQQTIAEQMIRAGLMDFGKVQLNSEIVGCEKLLADIASNSPDQAQFSEFVLELDRIKKYAALHNKDVGQELEKSRILKTAMDKYYQEISEKLSHEEMGGRIMEAIFKRK